MFFTGRPFAEADQRTMGLGWAAISAAVTKLADAPAGALGEAYDRHSDLGLAVEDVLEGADGRRPGAEPTLTEVAVTYAAITDAQGAAAKAALFAQLLARSSPLTAKYLVKVLSRRAPHRLAARVSWRRRSPRRSTVRSTW